VVTVRGKGERRKEAREARSLRRGKASELREENRKGTKRRERR
jgi:hypothetical protein